jgi:hypothetical protein
MFKVLCIVGRAYIRLWMEQKKSQHMWAAQGVAQPILTGLISGGQHKSLFKQSFFTIVLLDTESSICFSA